MMPGPVGGEGLPLEPRILPVVRLWVTLLRDLVNVHLSEEGEAHVVRT